MKAASYLALVALLASCATATKGGKRSGSPSTSAAKSAPLTGAVEEGSVEEQEEEEEETAGTEPVDGTPEDLGDVEASERLSSKELEADRLARSTFPLVQNEFVDQWISYFTGRGRKTFERYLARSTRYIPLMQKVLKQDGLPEDLIYLSMIESGFNPKAKSKAKAVGPWQFIKGTGTRYDLKVNYWVDERRDFVKSTHAAATYLKELYQIFGSWYLAAASYNAGEGKTLAAVRRERTRNFWELARKKPKVKEKKQNFRSETRNYVPKIIAAALISKEPEKYGFREIAYEAPFDWDWVKVPAGVDLRSVADAIGYDEERLSILNAELVRGITPPGSEGYDLKVPRQHKELLLSKLDTLKARKMRDFAVHTVRRGDTLGGIARRYGSDVQEILELNKLRSVRSLRVGMELSVPMRESQGRKKRQAAEPKVVKSGADTEAKESAPAAAKVAAAPVVASAGEYVVRDGDTLWDIAQKHGVSVHDLRKANAKLNPKRLRSGLLIKIPAKGG
jgi:membrane-bound lytic murein transglycosylase D